MIIILLAGIIPAIILVEIGRSWRPVQGKPESYPGWAGFLAVASGLLLAVTLLASAVFGESGSWLVMVLLPSICALFAEICLFLVEIFASLFAGRVKPILRWPAGLLLVIPLMLVLMGFVGDRFVLQVILFGGALLALGWLVWSKLGKWFVPAYLILLLMLVLAVWATDTSSDFHFLPAILARIARSLTWLAPGLGVILACRLFGWVLVDEQRSKARRLFLACLLILPIFLLLAWEAATASAWDVATDGLGGIFMLELTLVIGIAAITHQFWSLSSKQASFIFGFVVVIVVMILGANSFGTYGFDGKWGNVPRARTARRAAMINQAILHYHEEVGQYPQALADLTPGYLLYLPTPFMIPHQDWCYQGGPDYYRLGYVYRDYFSSPASVKVFAAAGQPPDPSWACEAEAEKYPAPSGYSSP